MAANGSKTRPPAANVDQGGRLGAVGWGLFIAWLGIVFLTKIDAWIALLGVGAIALGMQAVRKAFGLAFEGFWIIVGLLFVLGAVWDLSGTTVPLLPILLIAAGLALVLSIFRRQPA